MSDLYSVVLRWHGLNERGKKTKGEHDGIYYRSKNEALANGRALEAKLRRGLESRGVEIIGMSWAIEKNRPPF